MSASIIIGILGAVGLVIGINQLQNKSNPSEVISGPSPRNSPAKEPAKEPAKDQPKSQPKAQPKAQTKT